MTNLPVSSTYRLRSFRFSKTLVQQGCFAVCLLFIVSVSVYDSLLVVQFQETILHDERNPICAMLIQQDPHHLTWFLTGKTLGNLLVISTLIGLARFKYRHVMLVVTYVALFQLSLVFYLNYSDKQTGFLHFDGLFSRDPVMFASGIKSLLIHLTAVMSITLTAVTSWTIRSKCKTARKKRISIA